MALAIPVSVRQLGLDVIAAHDTAKYEIVGTDMQLLRLHLDPGEKVTAEPGAMVYAHSATKAGCNGDDCCARCLSGSPCIMGTFEATGPGAYVGCPVEFLRDASGAVSWVRVNGRVARRER